MISANDHGVDPQQLSGRVDQRPARVAGRQGHIGADDGDEIVFAARFCLSQGGNDPAGEVASLAPGMPEGKSQLPNAHILLTGEGDGLQAGRSDLEQRQINFWIAGDEAPFILTIVCQQDRGCVPPQHVVVRQDQPIGSDDDAGSGSMMVADHCQAWAHALDEGIQLVRQHIARVGKRCLWS